MRAVENKSILLLDLGEMKRGRCLGAQMRAGERVPFGL